MIFRRKTQQLKIACSVPLSGWDVMMEVRNRSCVHQLKVGKNGLLIWLKLGEIEARWMAIFWIRSFEFQKSQRWAAYLSLIESTDFFSPPISRLKKTLYDFFLLYHPFLMILQRLKCCRTVEKNGYFCNRLQKSLISFIYNKQRWKKHL